MGRRINGQGTLIRMENGLIRLKMQHGYLPNGRPRILTVTGRSETDCRKKMDAKVNACSGDLIARNEFRKITVSDLCYMHLKAHLNEIDRLKPKAADRRESTIKNQIEHYSIGSLQVASLSAKDVTTHIENLILEQKLSVSSIKKALDVINSAYKWAISQGYTNFNPCTSVMESLKNRLKNLSKKNSIDGIVHILGENEIKKLKDVIYNVADTGDNWFLFGISSLILLETGMRVGELCALRWKDWDRTNGTLAILHTRFVAKNRFGNGGYVPDENIVKNCRCRIIALSAKAVNYLEQIRRLSPKTDPDDYIVLNSRLNPTNPSNYGDRLKGLYKAAGLSDGISGAHTFRRTCATKMYNEGCTIEDIAAYLGDEPDTIRKHYISLTTRVVADGVVQNIVKLPTKK